MKRLIVLGLALVSCRANSQYLNEWMQQKQTQLTYLAEQVAAMKVYAGNVEKGYSIFRNGWDMVSFPCIRIISLVCTRLRLGSEIVPK
jgi:hypothetical protein